MLPMITPLDEAVAHPAQPVHPPPQELQLVCWTQPPQPVLQHVLQLVLQHELRRGVRT